MLSAMSPLASADPAEEPALEPDEFTPVFADIDDFKGRVIHAQHWPEQLNYKDKRVVVIGSGATAVTLVPTMSKDTASLVMLQRSPTYIASIPKEQPLAEKLRKWLPDRWVFRLTRWSRVFFQIYLYQLSRKKPQQLKKLLLGRVRQEMGPDYDVDTHFTPDYNPWDQRLCGVPDGDLFAAIRENRAEVVTDHIDHFNKQGIELKSGQQLDADIVVLATGLNLKFAGGVQYSVDNRVLDFTEHFIFRGMMFSDLPNMAFTVGYTNSSWTLKADLTAKYVSRLLNKMARRGYTSVTPRLKGEVEEVPLLDFDAGYVLRSRESFPKQGNRLPWKNYQNYIRDFIGLSLGRQNDDELEFHSWSSPYPKKSGLKTNYVDPVAGSAISFSGPAQLSRILASAHFAPASSCRIYRGVDQSRRHLYGSTASSQRLFAFNYLLSRFSGGYALFSGSI